MRTEATSVVREKSRGTNRLTITSFLVVGIVLGLTAPAAAWDGERKGFILGAGGGLGFVTITGDLPGGFPLTRTTSILLGTDAKIGIAPTNKVEYYLFGYSSWFSSGGTFTLNELIGLGLTYYPKREFLEPAPSYFVSCGLGASYLKPFSSSDPERYGFGLTFGGGYEFKKHMRVEGNFIWAKPSAKINGQRVTLLPWTFKILFSVLGY